MNRLSRLRPSPAMVVACIALTVALGGTSYAAIKLPKNSVGPKQLRKNAVTSLKVKDRSLLAKDFRSGQLPSGPKGDKGDKGDPGPSGSANVRWAHVRASGSVLAQSGGITVLHNSVSVYYVKFAASVCSKPILATMTRRDSGITGEVAATPCGGDPQGITCGQINDQNTILVNVRDSSGVSTDRAFFVAVVG